MADEFSSFFHSTSYANTMLQLRTAGSNVVFVALTEISDSVLRGAEMKGVDGLVRTHLLIIR